MVKNLPANAGDAGDVGTIPGFDPWVGKDPMEKEMATHSSILAWEIPWTEEPGGLQRVNSAHSKHLHTNIIFYTIQLVLVHALLLLFVIAKADSNEKNFLFIFHSFIQNIYFTLPRSNKVQISLF